LSRYLVFNHHSLPFQSVNEAYDAVPSFLKICLKCKRIGLSIILLDESVDSSWFRLKLAENFFWQDWYNQNNNDEYKELIRAFRSISINQPLFNQADISNDLELTEVFLNDSEYSAIKAAYWNESSIISFPSQSPWNISPLTIVVRKLDQNGMLFESNYNLLNFHSLDVVQNNEAQLLQDRNLLLASSRDLFKKRNELFPNLIFCGKTDEQLLNWSGSSSTLNQVIESLTTLNNFCEQFQAGEYVAYSDENLRQFGINHQVTGESETVHNTPELRKQREFFLPSGTKQMFEKHIKLSNGFRIHFFPNSAEKIIYVGYIGVHLKLR
jgi:hypothetical protein